MGYIEDSVRINMRYMINLMFGLIREGVFWTVQEWMRYEMYIHKKGKNITYRGGRSTLCVEGTIAK